MTTEVMPKPEKLTWNVREVSQLIGVSEDTLYALARQNQLPGLIRFGKRVLISKAAMTRAMNAGWTPDGGFGDKQPEDADGGIGTKAARAVGW